MTNTSKMARILHRWRPTVCIVKHLEGNNGNGGMAMLTMFELQDNGMIFFEYQMTDRSVNYNSLPVLEFSNYWEIKVAELINKAPSAI